MVFVRAVDGFWLNKKTIYYLCIRGVDVVSFQSVKLCYSLLSLMAKYSWNCWFAYCWYM